MTSKACRAGATLPSCGHWLEFARASGGAVVRWSRGQGCADGSGAPVRRISPRPGRDSPEASFSSAVRRATPESSSAAARRWQSLVASSTSPI